MHCTLSGRTVSAGLLIAIGGMSVSAVGDDAPAGWRKTEAAHYLDERAKTWLAFADAGRGEESTKTQCVSCHTISPYALARPALRKLTGAEQPTEIETRLVEQTKLRVANWDRLDSPPFRLLYDFDEPKKRESWGTEAVLNAVILAFDDRSHDRSAPGDSTRTALANMWRAQSSEGEHKGSWEWLNFGLEPWESPGARYFGAALAAIAVGTAPGYYAPGADPDVDQRVGLLRSYLIDHVAEQNLFNRIWLLWASHGLDGLATQDQRRTMIAELLEKQQSDGGWRLASLGAFTRRDGSPQNESSDGYATGLVLHVLQTTGVPKTDARIGRGLYWLRTNQEPSGEWRTSSLNKKRDPATHTGRLMSDAATAYAILALSH